MMEQRKNKPRRRVNKVKKFYSLNTSARKTKYPDKLLYKEVIESIFVHAKAELYRRHQVKILGIGKFYLKGIKVINKLVDYGATRKLGQVVYHTNFHTGRVRYEIRWRFKKYDGQYSFTPYRHLNRDLAKKLKGENE